MARLRDEGLIGAIGVTNFDAAHLALALADGIPLASNQVSFSLVDRRAAGPLAEFCARTGVRLLAYGTLCGGFLSERWLGAARAGRRCPTGAAPSTSASSTPPAAGTPFQGILAAAAEVARKHGVSISNVATRWVLDHPAVAAVIVGARITESEHRADNARALRLRPRRRGPRAPRRRLRRHHAHPRRLRRRVPPAALPHRLGRPQPPPRRHPEPLRRRARPRPPRPHCASPPAASGSRSPAIPARCASATASSSPAPPRPTAPTAASPPATPAPRRPTSSTRSPPRSPPSAAASRTSSAPASTSATPRRWEPVSRAHGRVFGDDPARQHARRGREPRRRLRGRDRGRGRRRRLSSD